MTLIPKNTIIRHKLIPFIKAVYGDEDSTIPPFCRMNKSEGRWEFHWRRRLNIQIRKRVNSIVAEHMVDVTEIANLIDLLELRCRDFT